VWKRGKGFDLILNNHCKDMEINDERPIDYSDWTRDDWQGYADWTIGIVKQDLMRYAYDDFWRDTQHTIISFDEASAKFANGLTKILLGKPQLAETTFPEYIAQAHPKGFTEYFISRLPIEAAGLKELLQERIRNSATTSAPPVQGAEIVTDGHGNVIGVAVYGKFQWLCSKADIGRICTYLADNNLVKQRGTALARKALQYFPESAKFKREKLSEQKTMEKAALDAINNANQEHRQASNLDLKASAEAVLRYW
jgi:hypothetical protein